MDQTNQPQSLPPFAAIASPPLALSAEIQRKLTQNAAQAGETVEHYLQRLMEHDACGGKPELSGDDDQDEARPWRGVFVPGRPRRALFSKSVATGVEGIPRRDAPLNMTWHREAAGDE